MRRPSAGLAALLSAILLVSACGTDWPFGEIREAGPLEPAPTLGDPGPHGTYLKYGLSLLRIGEFDLAKKAFIRSFRVEDTRVQALTGAGIAAERQGLLTQARRFFENARALAPDSVIAHNNLGVVLYRLGRYHEAGQVFRAAFALSSGQNDLAAHNLALAEKAVAEEESAGAPAAASHVVRRIGSSEYLILNAGDTVREGS